MTNTIHRDYKLKNEVLYVVLRLVQLRDLCLNLPNRESIVSVKYRGVELRKVSTLQNVDLSSINYDKVRELCNQIGYVPKRYVYHQVVSKIDITVNDKNYSIRCLNFIDRPLINHSHRRKYEEVCKRIKLPIEPLDKMVYDYWTCRTLGVFNEDCHPYSLMNPFVDHYDYLKELFTFMIFSTIDYNYSCGDNQFVAEKVDYILDYSDPCDDSTWALYDDKTYFKTVWPYLRFSMRDNKGMPSDVKLDLPENKDLWRWIRIRDNKAKGALHVRIEKFIRANYEKDFNDRIEKKYKKDIKKVKVNKGELDECLIKLFLMECKHNHWPVQIGNKCEIVTSVASSKDSEADEYHDLPIMLDWKKQTPKMIVFLCDKIKASKSPSMHKSDVYVNGIGISVKSRRGGPVTLINQTSREKILRVMQCVCSPMSLLDQIVDRYWGLRLNGKCGEDVYNLTMPDNPFCVMADGTSNEMYLTPLLNYFAFTGSGTADSPAQAEWVLSVGLPDDTSTWVYYSKSNFVREVWNYLIFSMRGKGLPVSRTPEMLPWIKTVDGKEKGTLNVRIKHLPE